MDVIPQKFRKNSYDYTFVRRHKGIVIYKQEKDNETYAYEVHKIRLNPDVEGRFKQPDGTIRVVKFKKKEKLGGNEDFGSYAWSFDTYGFVMEKFKELIMEVKHGKV